MQIFPVFSSLKRSSVLHKYACWNWLFFKVNTNHIIHPILLFTLQSVNDSHVPDTLLERLVADTTEFPPVSAVIGGILGQVFSRPSLFIRQDVLQY
jgi:hypothetical protein